MTLKPQDYYSSDIVDPFLNGGASQEESQEEGYEVYKQQSILQTIGTPECEVNIKLFYSEIIDGLSREGEEEYARDCLIQMANVYNLVYIDSLTETNRIFSDYSSKIFDLLIFLEGSRVADAMALCVPFVSLDVIRTKDELKEFLKLKYKEYLQNLENNRHLVPDLFYEEFVYASKMDGIETLVILLQKYALEIYAKQLVKGE